MNYPPSIETESQAIAYLMTQMFAENNNFYSSLTPEEKLVLDLCVSLLRADSDVTKTFTPSGIEIIKKITTFDFSVSTLSEIHLALTHLYDTYKDNYIYPTDNNTKEAEMKTDLVIACKHYSAGSNLSENYEFANNSNSYAICDNKKVPGHICAFPAFQSPCPYYSPDQGLYAAISFFNDYSEEYVYNVNYARTTSSTVEITVSDDADNIFLTLSYDASKYYQTEKDKLYIEIKDIVHGIHSQIHYKEEYNSKISSPQKEETDTKQSYLQTLTA